MSRLQLLSDHLTAPNMKTTSHPLSPPSLDELAKTLGPALEANYSRSSVSVVECPDLSQAPFSLAAKGLSGNECVADIGGQPHLFPRPLLEKKYYLLECAKVMGLDEENGKGKGMLIGAGAGPFHVIGSNSELAPNLSWDGGFETVRNETRFAKIEGTTDDGKAKAVVRRCPSTDCALMMNLFGSDGETGKVLRITAKARKEWGQKSFTECIRRALHEAYGEEKQVSLGGAFLLKRGKAMFHVMPDFPPEENLPFKDRHELNRWLTYHHFEAPIVCLTVFHSGDQEGLGLRMEHTHCFSAVEGKDSGGHYHHDLESGNDEAEEVEYEGYFNTARMLYRIDRPQVTLKQDLHD
jgi:hypothetical protein